MDVVKTTNKLCALFLSLVLMLGLIPGLSLAEDGFVPLTEDQMQAMAGDFWATADGEAPAFWSDLAIKGLKYIGGKVGEKIESDAWGTLWKTIFGDNEAERHQEIINKLNEINGKLDRIIAMLKTIQNDNRMREYKDSIQRKLDLMWKITNELNNRVDEFDHAKTQEQRYAILDKWYGTAVQGTDSFDLFTYYCGMLANTGGMNMDGEYFAQYDAYASLYWDWTNEGIPFRELQREKDLLLVSKMAALNTLWLAKEKELGRYDEIHERKAEQMRKAINQVLESSDRNPIYYTDGLTELHYDGRSMIFYGYEDHHTFPTSTYPVNQKHLRPRDETYDVRNFMRAYYDEQTPDSPIPGSKFHLITREEMKFLTRMAKDREVSIQSILTAGGIPYATAMHYAVFADSYNQPVSFGSPGGTMNSYRYMYFENADVTKIGDPGTNTQVGFMSVRVFDKDMFWGIADSGRYAVVLVSDDNTLFFDTNVFYPIWVLGDPLVPGNEAEEDAAPEDDGLTPDTGDTFQVTIESAEDGRLVIRWIEKDERLSLAYDDATVFTGLDDEPAKPEQLAGHTAFVTYTMDGESFSQGDDGVTITPALATLVTATEAIAPSEAQTVEGVVLRLESAAQIIGGNQDLVLDTAGARYTFHLPDGLTLDSRIHEGATIRVTYHESNALLIAEAVDLLSPDVDDPVGEPIEITSMVDHIDPLPGGGSLLVLQQPGGVLTLAIPQDLPLDDGIRSGATVLATYHVQSGRSILDAITLIAAPDPSPDPMPGPVPNPSPDDPIDPVSPDDPINPVYPQWAEGTIEAVDDAPARPGQPRTLTLLADQVFVLTLPADMSLSPDIQPGAYVHVDFHTEESDTQRLDTIMLILPVPHDNAMPGPISWDENEDPMPGPLDG